MKHLWEINHPYYGADGYVTECSSFAKLRESVDYMDEDMNVVYRWDWEDRSQPGKERGTGEFTVYILMPRKGRCFSITCPISKDQESEVLEWLRGPRVLGYLKTLWEPLLGGDK